LTPLDRTQLETLTRRPLPLLHNRVYRLWRGGAVLDRLQGVPDPADGNFPEEWVGSTTVSRLPGRPPEEGLSRVALQGGGSVVLKELIEAFPEAMLGRDHVARLGSELGVLCKLLDSGQRLGIQTHPSEAFARRHLNSPYGKTESWLVLATREIDGQTPYILFGFREGVVEAEFRRLVQTQDIPGQIAALNRIPVRPGEVYLVAAGTPHAIGPGLLLVEVQEPSDWVVNSEYTFGPVRRTEAQSFMGLSFDLGMQCFDYRAAGPEFVRTRRLAPRPLSEDAASREERLIGPEDTPCFSVQRLAIRGAVPDRDRGTGYIGVAVEGRGRLVGAEVTLPLAPGSAFFVPAASAHERYEADPDALLIVIKCFPPRG
jgi:mannose-6-phosphate isomerase